METVVSKYGLQVEIQLKRQTEPRRLTAAHLARWFDDGGGSYGSRLGLTAVDLQKVQTLYRRQLQDKMATWETAVAFVQL